MSNSHLTPVIPPSIAAKEAKEQRRKQLEEIRARRKISYQRFREHMRAKHQSNDSLV